jgi:hypothetical protein
MSTNPHAQAQATTSSAKECICIVGTCVFCILASPLLVVVGLVVYTLMLFGFTTGTAWGIASALKGGEAGQNSSRQHEPRLNSV